MRSDRARAAIFFGLYAAVLLYAFVWVRFPNVERRVSSFTAFYALIGTALVYVAVRAWLVFTDRVPNRWDPIFTVTDLLLITAAVRLTGGVHSEAGLMYIWPLATQSIQRRPRSVMALGVACILLYAVATWPERLTAEYAARLSTIVVFAVLVTALAAAFAEREIRRVEEMTRLREQVALSEYRSRLSQEMHDGIQHYLVSIAIRLEFARQMLAHNPRRAAALAVDQSLTVRQAADELRHLVRRLRSPALEQRGFVDALRDHLSIFAQRSGIVAPLEVQGQPRTLPPDTEQAAFRIVQEVLTNTEKHAHATEVRIKLRYEAERVECVVVDNGAGFDPSQVPSEPTMEGGFGLSSMHQRAEQVGGRLGVVSAPDQGTRITFTAPLGGSESAKARDVSE
ncbi:MAG: sensor histidine kinase [Armatimonadota bacterium]